MMFLHALLLLLTGTLAVHVIREDMRNLEISALPVFGLGGMLILNGYLFPPPGLAPSDAYIGACMGLLIGAATRSYIRWRTGHAGFGEADIVLIGGIGGLLGPYLIGPWLFAAASTGIVLFMIPAARRSHESETGTIKVIPFCPTLILSAGLVHALVLAGLLPANPF